METYQDQRSEYSGWDFIRIYSGSDYNMCTNFKEIWKLISIRIDPLCDLIQVYQTYNKKFS